MLADLGPAFESQGYGIQSHSADGVTFVRTRSLGRGVAGLFGAEKSIAVSLSDEDGGTRITIQGQGPARLKRAIDEL